MVLGFFIALAGGCDRAAPPDTTTATTEAVSESAQGVDVASHVGQRFDAFVASPGMERFSLENLDLAAGEKTRLTQAMAVSQPSRLISGGGAQALVFTGCAQAGCDTGVAVIAIGREGETFAGVRDAAGTSEFIPDDRMEALLRLNSSSRRWDDPGTMEAPGAAPAP
jgi:hypothetical protein